VPGQLHDLGGVGVARGHERPEEQLVAVVGHGWASSCIGGTTRLVAVRSSGAIEGAPVRASAPRLRPEVRRCGRRDSGRRTHRRQGCGPIVTTVRVSGPGP
jgi:hypothetical protein